MNTSNRRTRRLHDNRLESRFIDHALFKSLPEVFCLWLFQRLRLSVDRLSIPLQSKVVKDQLHRCQHCPDTLVSDHQSCSLGKRAFL